MTASRVTVDATRLAEADLLTGTVTIARYAVHGPPRILAEEAERDGRVLNDPGKILVTVLEVVRPEDLLLGGRSWRHIREAMTAERIARLQLPEWAETYGTAIGYGTLRYATVVLALAEARRNVRQKQQELATAIEAFDGFRYD